MPTILIVDDNAVDREQAIRCVEALDDLEVIEAEDGEQALELLERHRPDLVLTDLRMPKLDGLALVREAHARFPLVPVILMTSRGSELVAVDALASGAASYVAKADMVDHLPETVEQVLDVANAKRERAAILECFESSASEFQVATDPALIAPLVAFLQEELERTGFGDEQMRSQVGTALSEALSNAIIHGNLEVSSDLRVDGSEPYHRLIEERRVADPWSSRRVHCRAEQTPDRIHYVVRDEGPGFDPSEFPDPTKPENMLKARGRGLFLIHAFMDEVEHNEAGNEIRLTKRATAD